MYYLFKTLCIRISLTTVLFVLLSGKLLAASITLVAPPKALANRQPVVVQLYLNPEEDILSGVAGSFSFPIDMFTLDAITTESSVVSLWATQPSVSLEKYLDGRTHIQFEGIFPGGYKGVRSPYYAGYRPGILFSVTLIPKGEGVGSFIVDDITLNSFDAQASKLPSDDVIQTIRVPELIGASQPGVHVLQRVTSPTLTASILRDDLVNHNAWYLTIAEREQKNAIAKTFVAETDNYNAEQVDMASWREVSVPYVLLYQDRTKYVHVKIVYANNTYTTTTLAPVENSKSTSILSRILVSVITALFVLYFYGKSLLLFFRKKQ